MIRIHSCQMPAPKNQHLAVSVTKTINLVLLLLIFPPIISSCSFFNSQNYLKYSSHNQANSTKHTQAEIFGQIFSQTLEETQPLARQIAHDTAQQSWQVLEKNLIANIDLFLNWYFDYFNHKKQEFSSGLIYSDALIKNDFNLKAANQDFTTKFIENFQELFAEKVLEPEQVDIQTREITVEVLKQYLEEISRKLDAVPQKYPIHQADWEKYLQRVVIVIKYGAQNQLSLPLKSVSNLEDNQTFKALIATKPDWVKSEMLAQIAKQGAIKLLAKTGTNTAAVLGVRLIGKKILALGGVAWELWDYNHAIEVEKPTMRQELIEDLIRVKADILYQPESGIMSIIDKLELSVDNN